VDARATASGERTAGESDLSVPRVGMLAGSPA